MSLRLNHVTMNAGELQRSLRFYRWLGLVPIVHEPPRDAWLVCPDGDSTLSLEVNGEPALPARVPLHFECNARAERVALLRTAGMQLRRLPTDTDGPWREARLSDPDGHQLRLYWTGSDRLDPSWKITPADVPD